MTGSALPHSAVISEHFEGFLSDVSSEVRRHAESVNESAAFKGIFKNSLAAFSVLSSFRKGELPLLKSAAGIVRRLPMLIACRQLCLSYVELRRFVEVTSWYPYFRDHPVEWLEFLSHPESGIVRDYANPIKFAAHRDMAWHHAYAVARFESISWFPELIDVLSKHYKSLSAHVHAAVPATSGDLSLPFDDITEAAMREFQKAQRDVLAAGCLVVTAAKPQGLSKLPAVERAWFDWLIGTELSKTVRGSSLGAANRRRQT